MKLMRSSRARVGRGAHAAPETGKGTDPPADQLSAQRAIYRGSGSTRTICSTGPMAILVSANFRRKSQLIVQHFMFGPDWDAGCKSCSFWADNFNGIVVHLQQRDIAFARVARRPSSGSKIPEAHGLELQLGVLIRNRLQPRLQCILHPGEIAAGEIHYN